MRRLRTLITLSLVFAMASVAFADTIPESKYGMIRSSVGMTPRQLYTAFGVPTRNEHPRLLNHTVSDSPIALIQIYDLEGGGRVAFMFGGGFVVNGIVFDRLMATTSPDLPTFFLNGIPRASLLIECEQKDFYHVLEGESSPIPTIAAEWSLRGGGAFYARFRAETPLERRYDPDTATMRAEFPRELDSLPLLQFGYFPRPGSTRIMDLPLTRDNSDFSMLFSPTTEQCK